MSDRERTPQPLDQVYEESVLCRLWKPSCALAWVFFILFEIFIVIDYHYSRNPLCPHSDKDYGNWYWYYNYSVLGGFVLTWFSLALKILLQKNTNNKAVPMYVAFHIVTMSTIATILAVNFENGVCIDVLGVASPATIWAEWLACGPLLILTTLTIVDKPNLTNDDWLYIATMFFCLLFAFFIIIRQPLAVGIFWLILSVITYSPGLLMAWYTERDRAEVFVSLTEQEKGLYAEKYAKRNHLSGWLTIAFLIYVIDYSLALFGCFGPATTIVIYQILSILTKGPFAAITMDIHLDMLFDAERALLEEQRLNDHKANESRRGFMKYIFHEVRTPLNSLTMGIDLLQSSPNLDDQDREYLLMMRSSSEFMSDTLDDVLNMQKIEEGKFELEYEPFSFKPAITRIFNTFRGGAIQKNIALSSFISPDTPEFVKGDMHRIEHVIGNFLSNAIKFTPENKRILISVNVLSSSKQDGKEIAFIKVSVEDEGIGISQENQALLFNNFVQIRPSELQKGKGSGLGLALCKQVVSLHGGTIGVESQEGHGTSFYFIIPFEVIPVEIHKPEYVTEKSKEKQGNDIISPLQSETVSRAQQRAVVSEESSSPSGLNVLVVDDAESNAKMIVMLLKRINVSSKSASDGKEALDLVRANPLEFDMVLMDNLMPVMTGLDSAKLMREMGFSNIIVGLTGNVMDDDIRAYLDAGADSVVAKPLKKATLDKLILFINTHGPVSNHGMQIVDKGDCFVWIPRV